MQHEISSPSPNHKNQGHGHPRQRFWMILVTVCDTLFIKSNGPAKPLKLQQEIMLNACFGFSKPSVLASKLRPFLFLSKRPPRHIFFGLYVDFMWQRSIWGPLQNPVCAKRRPKLTKWRQTPSFLNFMGMPFCRSWFVDACSPPICLTFGTLLVPTGSLVLNFKYSF